MHGAHIGGQRVEQRRGFPQQRRRLRAVREGLCVQRAGQFDRHPDIAVVARRKARARTSPRARSALRLRRSCPAARVPWPATTKCRPRCADRPSMWCPARCEPPALPAAIARRRRSPSAPSRTAPAIKPAQKSNGVLLELLDAPFDLDVLQFSLGVAGDASGRRIIAPLLRHGGHGQRDSPYRRWSARCFPRVCSGGAGPGTACPSR